MKIRLDMIDLAPQETVVVDTREAESEAIADWARRVYFSQFFGTGRAITADDYLQDTRIGVRGERITHTIRIAGAPYTLIVKAPGILAELPAVGGMN